MTDPNRGEKQYLVPYWDCEKLGGKHQLKVLKVLSFFSQDVKFLCQKCRKKVSYDRNVVRLLLTESDRIIKEGPIRGT